MLKNHQKILNIKKKSKKQLIKQSYEIVKNMKNTYKKLSVIEKELLYEYKNTYYNIIRNYIIYGGVSYTDIINSINNNRRDPVNIGLLYNNFITEIENNITLLDNIIKQNGITKKINVYRGIYETDNKQYFLTKIHNISKKKGNILDIETFQSTTLDIYTSEDFIKYTSKKGIILEIETNGFPYIYLPWNIGKEPINKEILYNSEFELLLPKNLQMEYVCKKKIYIDKINIQNWRNYKKKGDVHFIETYIYTFRIIGYFTPKEKKKQDFLSIPVDDINTLYLM